MSNNYEFVLISDAALMSRTIDAKKAGKKSVAILELSFICHLRLKVFRFF